MFGKARVLAVLVPKLFSIGDDNEVSSLARDHLEFSVGESFLDCGLQTGGLGEIVSDHAVFDRDFHAAEFTRNLRGKRRGG